MTEAPSASRAIVPASAASAATWVTPGSPAGPEPWRLTTPTRSPRSASIPATRLPITPAPTTSDDSPMGTSLQLPLSLESSALEYMVRSPRRNARAMLSFVVIDLASVRSSADDRFSLTHRPGTGPGGDHRGDPGRGSRLPGHRRRAGAEPARHRPGSRHGFLGPVPLLLQPRRAADQADHRRLRLARGSRRGLRGGDRPERPGRPLRRDLLRGPGLGAGPPERIR